MPSDNVVSSSDTDGEQQHNNHSGDILLHDRSLTDMLQPTPSQPTPTGASNNSGEQSSHSGSSNSQNAIAIELEHIKESNLRLQNQVDLLHAELSEQQKLIKRQKCEIKRLTNENDNQRRILSRYQGIRRFTMQAGDNTKACQTDSLPDALVGSAASKSDHVCQDDVDMTRAKLESLRDHVRQFAGSLLTAIDQDTDPEFTLVSNNKRSGHPSRRNQQPATSMPQRTTSTSRQRPSLASGAQAQHPSLQGTQVDPRQQPDEHGTQSRSSGQRIPVVQLGAANAAR